MYSRCDVGVWRYTRLRPCTPTVYYFFTYGRLRRFTGKKDR